MTTTSLASYAKGEELDELRSELDSFRETLLLSEAINDKNRVKDLAKAIEKAEARDPDIAYAKALADIELLQGKHSHQAIRLIEKLAKQAQFARTFLPRFQMEGLWAGTYGTYGLQLINVTYDGDTMIATKVTGDECVPRGETCFTADLGPRDNTTAAPLSQGQSSALPRYAGKGQVAKPGHVGRIFIGGQCVLSRDCFSFVWVGLPPQAAAADSSGGDFFHQVLFRRPAPAQTLELLRNVLSREDEMENVRRHLGRCLNMDEARQGVNGPGEPFRRIPRQEDLSRLQQDSAGGSDLLQQQQQQKGKLSVVDKFLNRIRNKIRSLTTKNSDDDVFC